MKLLIIETASQLITQCLTNNPKRVLAWCKNLMDMIYIMMISKWMEPYPSANPNQQSLVLFKDI